MRMVLDLNSVKDYQTFIKAKSLPTFRCVGREIFLSDEYAAQLGVKPEKVKAVKYKPIKGLFDYQRDIAALAIKKKKFAVFMECVAGETIVNSPDGDERIEVLAGRGVPVRVWALNSDGEPVIANATCPWINGFDELYEITLHIEFFAAPFALKRNEMTRSSMLVVWIIVEIIMNATTFAHFAYSVIRQTETS